MAKPLVPLPVVGSVTGSWFRDLRSERLTTVVASNIGWVRIAGSSEVDPADGRVVGNSGGIDDW